MTESDLRAAFREHKDTMYRYSLRMTGSENAAEDIAQGCFLQLVRRPNGYDPSRGPLRSFLAGIARNLIHEHLRKEGRYDLRDEDHFEAPATNASADTALIVAEAVQSLPPLQREAVILAEYEGLSLAEIARAAGAEPGAVRARLHRARENLRRILAPLDGHEERRSAGHGATTR